MNKKIIGNIISVNLNVSFGCLNQLRIYSGIPKATTSKIANPTDLYASLFLIVITLYDIYQFLQTQYG